MTGGRPHLRPRAGAKPRRPLPPGACDTQTHMYLERFSPPEGAPMRPAPPLPTPGEYRRIMDWLGLERVVITQGNAHGADNANLLACLAEMGDCARGVAVISAGTQAAELAALHAAGVRGARIMDLHGGAMGMDRLAEVDAIAADLGWVVAVQFDGAQVLDHMGALQAMRARWILDHHGKFLSAMADPDGVEAAAVLSLIDRGRCWFKFAACYESSRAGAPDYADVGALAARVGAYAPERIIWGTNWPHNSVAPGGAYPDDAGMLDRAMDWAGSERAIRLMLAETPARLFDFPSPKAEAREKARGAAAAGEAVPATNGP